MSEGMYIKLLMYLTNKLIYGEESFMIN